MGGGAPVDTPPDPAAPYQPLVVGAVWTYSTTSLGITTEERNIVEATEDMGGTKTGITAFRVREELSSGVQLTWYEVNGMMVLRHHEQALDVMGAVKSEDWYDPYRLRFDETPEHTAAGATWPVSYTVNHTARGKPASTTVRNETWKVEAVDEPVTVPAGTYPSIRISRTDLQDGSVKTYWFARGIGKVKELAAGGQVEELVSYTAP
jgi:hypothetical protein